MMADDFRGFSPSLWAHALAQDITVAACGRGSLATVPWTVIESTAEEGMLYPHGPAPVTNFLQLASAFSSSLRHPK